MLNHFLKVPVVYDPSDEDVESYMRKQYRRMAVVPFENIYYIQENEDKNYTDIILQDGDLLTAMVPYDTIFSVWEEWFKAQANSHLSFLTRSN